MLRFKHNSSNPQQKLIGFLTSSELQQAKFAIFKLVQQASFSEDYNCLLINKPIPRNSKLLQLNPFLDDNKLIRVGGRLDNATISYDQRHPIILPRDHHVTSLLIDKMHLETLHGGPSLVLATSRSQFWIIDARRVITSRIHKCVTCTRFRKATTTQLMGNLPSARVNISKPFTKVGIDYAGPITIKASPCRKAKLLKAYFCIFVCMVTKAIHIELVSSLTSEAFLAALKRFVARRGLCTDIYSDCGTNFVGGKTMLDRDLRDAIKEATSEAAQYFASKSINWHFNPPASPHFGGLWEAGVKSIKYHLKRVLRNSIYTFEEYATILSQIEACLNSRPLCYVHNSPDESVVLTPGHFLIGQALNAIPEPDYADHNITQLQRWKLLQQKIKQFWDKWSKDYLNQMQNRPKWARKEKSIEIGDIVLIKNENSPNTSWPLGIIEQVYPGKDGLVRVVQVKTQNSVFQRPISKICPLPVDKPGVSENRSNLQLTSQLCSPGVTCLSVTQCCVCPNFRQHHSLHSFQMAYVREDDDILDLYEDVYFTPPSSPVTRLFVEPGCDVLTGQPIRKSAWEIPKAGSSNSTTGRPARKDYPCSTSVSQGSSEQAKDKELQEEEDRYVEQGCSTGGKMFKMT